MSWVKIDDQFVDHPKLVRVGSVAGWLYVCGLCYCARYLTDGFIPKEQVSRMVTDHDVTPLVTALLTQQLWVTVDGGYKVHDYLKYNPSQKQVLEQREYNAKRQAKFRNSDNNI